MIIKEVTQIGDPVLHKKSKLVRSVNSEEVQRVVKNLVDSMRYHSLVGMAAPQIGEQLRIFVTEVRKTKHRDVKRDKLRIYINPKIIRSSKKKVSIYEGCGSVAYSQLFAPVSRPEKIEVEAFDEKGDKFGLKADGLLARVIQHECDHLDGIEFVKRVKDVRNFISSGEYIKKMALKNK